MIDQPTPLPRRSRGPAPLLGTLTLAALLAVATAACSSGGASPSGAPSAPPPSAAPSESPVGAVPPAVVDNAIADAAQRAGVDPSEVTVVAAEAHQFPNGALGCPEPGKMYTEVITPGYRVVVEAGRTRYDYRASARSSEVHWCENPPQM